MKPRIDIKSLLIGLILGAAGVLTIAASPKSAQPPGRFQTVINAQGFVVMTDTATGQAWSTVVLNPGRIEVPTFTEPKLR